MTGDVAVTVLSGVAASIGPARDFVRRAAESMNEPEIRAEQIDDVVLVASELVTNAVEHGTGDDVEVALSISGDRIVLSVTGAADGLPRPSDDLPPVESLRGRGLVIAASLSTDVIFERFGNSNRVRCEFTVD